MTVKRSRANRRLSSPVKRDPYSEVLEKHNDLVKRGENPGDGHLIERKFGANGLPKPLLGNPPTVSPAVALDEDGDDISKSFDITCTDSSLLRSDRDRRAEQTIFRRYGFRFGRPLGPSGKLQKRGMCGS